MKLAVLLLSSKPVIEAGAGAHGGQSWWTKAQFLNMRPPEAFANPIKELQGDCPFILASTGQLLHRNGMILGSVIFKVLNDRDYLPWNPSSPIHQCLLVGCLSPVPSAAHSLRILTAALHLLLML